MKGLTIMILTVTAQFALAQADSTMVEITKFQEELNEEYRNPKTSPIKGKAQKRFKMHDFFPIDIQYRVEATLTVTNEAAFFPMMTSSQVPKDYRIYGMLEFVLKDKVYNVPVYQSKMLMVTDKYKNYLFFPFTDLTNGKLTYAAGRYIELSIPKNGNKIILDFNKAYNPYCAYSDGYSCPIVPSDNYLDVEILAGVRYLSKKRKH
jgi:uncharacterized protein (DUF1684 family)